MRDFFDGLWEFIAEWLIVVGSYAAFIFTIRLLGWLTDLILLGG